MIRILALAVLGCTLSLAACTNGPSWDKPGHMEPANNSDMNNNGTSNNMSSNADSQFVMNAAAGGAYEIQSSQLALQKTNDPHIRMIAQHMINDHTKANKKLMAIAQPKGITVSETPSPDQQQMIEQLRGLSSTDFDQTYISQQTTAHKQTIAMFQQEADNGSDAALRAFANNTLPTLKSHLRMITGESNDSNMGNK